MKSSGFTTSLYGPEKALFDKTWKLPDIAQTAAAEGEVAA
jgi:hypothetical protein